MTLREKEINDALSLGNVRVLRSIVKPALSNEDWCKAAPLRPAGPKVQESRWVETQLKVAAEKGAKSRAKNWQWRIEEAIRQNPDWYPVMDTLTIAPIHYGNIRKVLQENWQQYLTRVQEAVGKHISDDYKQFRNTKKESYCCYAATVEKASRWHIHVIWLFKDMPDSWKRDPNTLSGPRPEKREIGQLKQYWPEGFSTPKAVRYHINDVWGQLGWRWPTKGGKPIKAGSPGQVAAYIAKYITKDQNRKGPVKWRTRATTNLGLHRLATKIASLPTNLLRPLCQTQHLVYKSLKRTHWPTMPIRRLAWRERLHRLLDCQSPQRVSRVSSIAVKSTNRKPSLIQSLRATEALMQTLGGEFAAWLAWQECLTNDSFSNRIATAQQVMIQFLDTPNNTTSYQHGGTTHATI